MAALELLVLQIAVILLATRLVSAAFRFVGQPGVVGEMAAGILLGPSLLGRISPTAMNALFPSTGLAPLYALSQLGLVLFMFMVGLELRPGLIRSSAQSVLIASQASIVAPVLCGAGLAWALYPSLGNGAPRLPFVMFLGTAMGVTAFPVLARILADRKLTHTRAGMFAISCAAVDDLAAWCLLAAITVIAKPDANQMPLPLRFAGLAVYILAMVFLIRTALRRMLPANGPLTLAGFVAILAFVVASARATEALAVHAFFGAFLAGIIMPKGGRLEREIRARLEWMTLVVLLPLYFAYTGLRTSVGLLNTADAWLQCGLILLVAVGSKLLVTTLSVRAGGMPWRESLAVGVLVNTRGLVEFVVLNAGLDLHIISPAVFSMMVIMALATTLMTAPLIDRILRGEQSRLFSRAPEPP